MENTLTHTRLDQIFTKENILRDYRIGWESRHASLLGRKEAMLGRAKFGIFGDGKELAQLAMAKAFENGDFRSGYYRDQTFMFAIEQLTLQQWFAQLYATPSLEADPASAGRMMNGHFATRSLDERGNWKKLTQQKNSSADISSTAGQMPRLVGLAFASKIYRQNPDLKDFTDFSIHGNEIAFGTIGDASTSEGLFFEAINAAGVLQIPMLMSVWDDGYGISVPKKYQTTKGSISEILAGFQRSGSSNGYEILRVRGWDYEALCQAYLESADICRNQHVPVLLHVEEITQPQGHSTSGSHERYKSEERLQWEKEYDCLAQFRRWILQNDWADAETLDRIEKEAQQTARQAKTDAWAEFTQGIKAEQQAAEQAIQNAAAAHPDLHAELSHTAQALQKTLNPIRKDAIQAAKKALRLLRFHPESPTKTALRQWITESAARNADRYNSHLYSASAQNALQVEAVPPIYSESSPTVDGREVLQACFDQIFARDPRVLAFGEDVGFLGDVNQALAGMQEKYGELRVMDTGIREMTIIGQATGLAMRGLRPIAEIQYLDYLVYALPTITDDIACLQYRTKGGQKAPLIIRTRGHRLEGIWHSGSPISMILGSFRGIRVLVPRNMTQAAGFYNTMLASDEPALIIESLNGYRLKERVPDNIAEFRVPLGVPEVLREGSDITLVTYGSMCRIAMEAAELLEEAGISLEVIDVQTLLPFDRYHRILESIQKTNRVIFTDEDVSGGTTGYMLQKVLNEQNAYRWLDAKPVCVSAQDHRPAYASDGDYFSKPNVDTLFEAAYAIMHECDPRTYPAL